MSPARRFFTLLFAGAQIFLGAGLAVIDGALDVQSASGAAASHVEAEGSPSCPRQHLADCAVCRALEVLGSSARGTGRDVGATSAHVAVFAAERDPQRRVATRLPDSRAPPSSLPGAPRPPLT